ncbi:NADH:flavin oxidoreductase [Pelagibius litoralis]|uniref:NADH:flavin oxidoreductase n=1 Tax=Pelagibius litoralis TaxID=374515 RepID=A0A967EXR0_9PROT|nr:FAD-dependent oxidoreductase [Pelagibius litoralis]NIA69352.1 NADH:flavin oxidoreductase [Pelagibius litoralis]
MTGYGKDSRTSARDKRYDILFEPVRIGPVTTRNRFYQVPHCNGMGRAYPSSMAEMRGVKAEGGWGVVCTEQVEIHHTSELSPVIEGRLWDDADLPVFQKMTDKIHEHGSLAGIEPCYDGLATPNRYSREIPMGPSARPVTYLEPVQARAMDKTDIRNLRRWYVDAARRSRLAGFDIIYVYAGHDLNALSHFLSRRWNDRGDEYGGSLENRARLLREVLADTREAVGDTCAVALRFGVEELLGDAGFTSGGEGREVVEALAEIPDLWDVNVSDWSNDSATSRFAAQGFQDSYVAFVKKVTSKPVVGVGRYTSPDAMVALIKSGALDLIGAARPSIADPFLPKKVEEGRVEDIRECIGCNICVSGDFLATPMRCTQNPTMGEEWRKGWHPERIAPKTSEDSVLIVGAGPAGLEAARALGQRGYAVTLAEAGKVLGGRVAVESRLPGLSEWKRVADYREYQINQMVNVETYLDSRLTAEQVLEFEADHVVVATGARWCTTGVGRANTAPIPVAEEARILTPDDIAAGPVPDGPVVIFDDDHYFMGGLLAELLRGKGHEVTLVTPAADVSHWTHNTLEQARIQKRLIEMDVRIRPLHSVVALGRDTATLQCVYTERRHEIACSTFVPVTMRRPVDTLYHEILRLTGPGEAPAPKSLGRIGDCLAPGTIAAAVYGGHRYARELGEPVTDAVPFRRELPQLATN